MSAPAGDRAIRCAGLIKIYKIEDVEVVALQGLDLEVDRGELMGIIGPSGSGKTTLMSVLGGLDTPSAGRPEWRGSTVNPQAVITKMQCSVEKHATT